MWEFWTFIGHSNKNKNNKTKQKKSNNMHKWRTRLDTLTIDR